jgi:hypothetical protein
VLGQRLLGRHHSQDVRAGSRQIGGKPGIKITPGDAAYSVSTE